MKQVTPTSSQPQLPPHTSREFAFSGPFPSSLGGLSVFSFCVFLAVLVAFVGFPAYVRGEIDLGNRGALAFGFDGEVEYDSNITRSSAEEEDVLLVGYPKVLYRLNEGAAEINAFVGVEFREYIDNSEFDSENFKSGLSLFYPRTEGDRNFEVDLSAGFVETTQADDFLQAIVERDVITGNFIGKYFFTDRYYMKLGLRYRDEEVQEDGFSDVRWVAVPIDFLYRYSDLLSLGLGYQYRNTTLDGGLDTADNQDHAVYFVVEGRVAPSVGAEGRIGFQKRNFDDSMFEDSDGVFAELVLDWDLAAGASVELTAGNAFETTALSNSVETLYLELEYVLPINEKLEGKASLAYEESDFSSLAGDDFRTDEEWTASVGAEYELIEDRLALNALLRYSDQSSNISDADYSRLVALVGISLVY